MSRLSFSKVSDLRPNLKNINIIVKCDSVGDEREVVSKRTGETLRVADALVGDETGCIYLTLWNDEIDKMAPGQIYVLRNVYTTIYRNSLRLNIGRYGSVEEDSESRELNVNMENNLSDRFYEQQRRPYKPRLQHDRGEYRRGRRY
ncbi:MAG: single-stranded DNA-binding protein [Candidatus Freyarchaeota archaeon]|nr:single-stranded DNA-binding protein [Candidatus Jordarchaeia archaeon]